MASLIKFGVPVTAADNALMMPKLQYRFRVLMYNFGLNNGSTVDFTQNVVSVTRPSVTHEEVILDAYNSKAYIAGKHSWEAITLTVRDDMNNSASRHIASQLQRQLNHGLQSAPPTAHDYKFGIVIEQLDGSGSPQVLESWSLNGCFLQNVNYGENNYATSEAMTITLQIRYDNADIHSSKVASASTNGGLTEGLLGNQAYNSAV